MKLSLRPAQVILLLAGILLLANSCRGPEDGRRFNVLFIIVDTLRADHLGCYGNNGVRTPYIDDLASQGARFSTVVTAAPVTAPSVTSLLTGTFPVFHGVRDNELFCLNPDLPTLASLFRRAGYATAGFVGSVVLDRRYGFGQGFDHYDDDMSGELRIYDQGYIPQKDELQGTQRRAEDVTEVALRWLRVHGKEKPFLCFVHYFDPHDPYDPPPPFNQEYAASPYDGEIAYADAQIGVLLKGIRDLGVEDKTLVVLTADHGEGLGEHGERTHGFFLYDSTILVPLIFRLHGVIPSGGTFQSQARTVDVMPTILDLAGVTLPETAQGASLAGGLTGRKTLEDRDAYVETFHTLYSYNWHELQAIKTRRWKYVRAPEPELYDLHSDAGERENLAGADPETTSRMERSLESLEERLEAGAAPFRATRSEHDEEMVDKMRALGYLGGASHRGGELPSPGGDLPDPKVKMAELSARQEAGGHLRVAVTMMMRGEFQEALEQTAEARKIAPDYAEIQATEGLILARKGDLDQGIALMESAIEKDPRAQMVHQTLNNLGLAYLGKGECEKAIATIEKSLAVRPDYANAMYNLGLAHEKCGDPKAALEAYEAYLKAAPNLDPALVRSVKTRMEKLRSSAAGGR
jgi:choline-sulfatase